MFTNFLLSILVIAFITFGTIYFINQNKANKPNKPATWLDCDLNKKSLFKCKRVKCTLTDQLLGKCY